MFLVKQKRKEVVEAHAKQVRDAASAQKSVPRTTLASRRHETEQVVQQGGQVEPVVETQVGGGGVEGSSSGSDSHPRRRRMPWEPDCPAMQGGKP